MQSLIAAIRYLTVWGRLVSAQPISEPVGALAAYFPLVGLILGLILALLNYALSLYVEVQLLSIFLIGFLMLATGAAHCDGVKNTFNALLANRVDENSRETIFGSAVVFLLILLKIRAVEVIDDKIILSLLLTPALARWTLVIFIFGYSENCEETTRRIAENLRFWHVLVTTIAILALGVISFGRRGLWLGLCLSVVALLLRGWLHRRHAVLTQDDFGAIIELSETLCFVLLALF